MHLTLWRQWLSLQIFLQQSFCSFTEKGASKKGIKIPAGVHQSFAHIKKGNKVCIHLIIASDFTTVHITAGNIWIFQRTYSTSTLYMSIADFSVLYLQTNMYCSYKCSVVNASGSCWMTINLFILRLKSCYDWIEKMNKLNFVNVFMYFTQNSYLNGIATLEDKEVDAWISNSKCCESVKR